jgi:hypothetical protein
VSYDIHLVCVRGDKYIRFQREVFEAIFLPHCAHLESYRTDPEFMQVEYPDGSRSDIYILNRSDEELQAHQQARGAPKTLDLRGVPPGDRADIQYLGFDHFGGDSFFRDLYALTDRIDAVIVAGSIKTVAIVTKESVLKEIPKTFQGMKNARVVHNPAELEEAVWS